MTSVEDYQNQLNTLKKAQKDNESDVLRAEIALEEAKAKVLEAFNSLKELGFSTVSEATSAMHDLQQKIEDAITKAADILEVDVT